MNGCAITKQLFPPVVEDRDVQGALQNQNALQGEEHFAWIDEYFIKINGLNAEGLLKEQESNQQAYTADKTELNQLKLFLSLIAMPQPEHYNDLLSLIDDSMEDKEDQAQVILFLLKSYAVTIEQYNNLLVENEQLVAKKKRLETLNSQAETRLQASQLEKSKLANQLKELKSIEASLIQRDMREDTVTP